MERRMKDKIVYILTIIFSILFIYFGNQYVSKDLTIFKEGQQIEYQKVKVVEILNRMETDVGVETEEPLMEVEIEFNAKVLTGKKKGKIIKAVQTQNPLVCVEIKEVEVGDTVLIMKNHSSDLGEFEEWSMAEYVRTDHLIVLGLIFVIALLVFGKWKGLHTVLSLGFTCLVVFLVFIPAVLAGKNIYLYSIIVCIYIAIMTLLIVNGTNRKSLAAALGCIGGTTVAGIITVIMDKTMQLTGFLDENSTYLLYINKEHPIDLKAIIFGGILIGSIGAVMDVSVDIAASLHEISRKIKNISRKALMHSGFTIGRDILGTMANTLVLAYVGSSLSTVLLLVAYNGTSLIYLLNMERLVVEMLQALAGSIGILCTIPLTSMICGLLFGKKGEHKDRKEKKEEYKKALEMLAFENNKE